MLRQLLLFPDSPELISTGALRPTQFRVLLELNNGLIGYVLVTQRDIPTTDQLAAMAPTLNEAVTAGYALTHTTDLIHQRHGLAAEVLDSPFTVIDEWKIDHVVQACLASVAINSLGRNLTTYRRNLLETTQSNLQDRLTTFIASLDPETSDALGKAEVRPSRYNYLAGGNATLRRNRIQAHRLFPWLMPHLLWNNQLGQLPHRVREAIDQGLPLVDILAQGFSVSPSVIKAMSRCPGAILAATWNGNVKQLAISLHGITPEFRPKSDQSWLRMGQAVELIEKGTGQSITRPQNQLWLAASARRDFDLKMPNMEDTAALTQGLADMSNAMREVLAMRIGGHQAWHAGWLSRHLTTAEVIHRMITHALGHLEFGRLLEIVRRWQDAFRRQQSIRDQDSELIRGLTWRAPIDEFNNESRVIVPLLSQTELIEEGRAMDHCVGSYTCDCRLGQLQIWSIRTLEGQRCSTLATRFERLAEGSWRAVITQHRGKSNVAPDSATKHAAHELLRTLSAGQAEMMQFWEWRRTLAQLSPKERGMLIATRALERSLQDALPRKLSLAVLEAEIHLVLKQNSKPLHQKRQSSLSALTAT